MAIPTAYLTTAKNLKPILEAMQRAGVPARVTYEFLKQLGYASSSDRPVLAVLKALGFLAESGEPTERYRRYIDPSQSRSVLAEAIRDAYADVFTVDQSAYKRSTSELRGIFARLSDKGDAVNLKMATTFKTLSELADFAPAANFVPASPAIDEDGAPEELPVRGAALVMHHDVHIHLPLSTEIAVYDAIFRSLRENLM